MSTTGKPLQLESRLMVGRTKSDCYEVWGIILRWWPCSGMRQWWWLHSNEFAKNHWSAHSKMVTFMYMNCILKTAKLKIMNIYQTHCLCGSWTQEPLSWVVLAQSVSWGFSWDVTGAAVIRTSCSCMIWFQGSTVIRLAGRSSQHVGNLSFLPRGLLQELLDLSLWLGGWFLEWERDKWCYLK